MRIFVFLVLIALLGACKTKTGSEAIQTVPNESNLKATTISFDEEIHDFGKVISGQILTFSFVFRNTGQNNLHILNTETDCGCINAKLPPEPVKPGENGFIEVIFNSAGMVGKQLKTIEIKSNSKEVKHLIIFANVENELFESIN